MLLGTLYYPLHRYFYNSSSTVSHSDPMHLTVIQVDENYTIPQTSYKNQFLLPLPRRSINSNRLKESANSGFLLLDCTVRGFFPSASDHNGCICNRLYHRTFRIVCKFFTIVVLFLQFLMRIISHKRHSILQQANHTTFQFDIINRLFQSTGHILAVLTCFY